MIYLLLAMLDDFCCTEVGIVETVDVVDGELVK